ncbi:MAG TPA: pilus assembly protein TadG-related protein [Anaerolineales bacterium]|nr:pilus assembly protein TadG-related protein [Anaerolineales bacterium]
MRPKAQERGQALVIIALTVVGLFGFSALAIDGSRVFSDRRNAQNAADTAALSAALTKIRGTGTDYKIAAENRAASNGYIDDADSQVEVNLCSELIGTPNACQAIPTSGEEAQIDPANYIQVKITSVIPATFARIVGRNEFTNIVTAVAYSGPVEPQPIVKGAALAALKEEGDKTLFGNGVVTLDVNNSGVFNNSRDNCATTIAGAGSTYTVDTSFQMVNTAYCSGAGNNTLNPVTSTSPIEYPPTFNIQEPTITCSGNGSRTENGNTITYSPGNFPSGDNLNYAGTIIFQPGNYCFGSNVTINGSSKVIADHVNFLITGGQFSLRGNSVMTCNDLLVHIDGGTGLSINGISEIHCNDVTFFASTGNVSWDGNAVVRLFAPKGGEYKNLLIYMPFGNSSDFTITGTSDNELTGSIIAVSSNIKIAGVSGTKGLHSQIIGFTVEIKGSTDLLIEYVPEEQYWEVDPTAVTLTK